MSLYRQMSYVIILVCVFLTIVEIECFSAGDRIRTVRSAGQCAAGQWACGNGHCISSIARCDGLPNCADSSDENGCGATTCAETKTACNSGECIDSSLFCDGVNHCRDKSDETNCDTTTITYAVNTTTLLIEIANETTTSLPNTTESTTTAELNTTQIDQNITDNATDVIFLNIAETTTPVKTASASPDPQVEPDPVPETENIPTESLPPVTPPNPITADIRTTTPRPPPIFTKPRTTTTSPPPITAELQTTTTPPPAVTAEITTRFFSPIRTMSTRPTTTEAASEMASNEGDYCVAMPDHGNFCRRRYRGYYRHPTNCNNFVMCEWGLLYLCRCPPRTVWDVRIENCVWEFFNPC